MIHKMFVRIGITKFKNRVHHWTVFSLRVQPEKKKFYPTKKAPKLAFDWNLGAKKQSKQSCRLLKSGFNSSHLNRSNRLKHPLNHTLIFWREFKFRGPHLCNESEFISDVVSAEIPNQWRLAHPSEFRLKNLPHGFGKRHWAERSVPLTAQPLRRWSHLKSTVSHILSTHVRRSRTKKDDRFLNLPKEQAERGFHAAFERLSMWSQ